MSYISLALQLLHLRGDGPKVSIHRNPFFFNIFLVVLLAALPQLGCVGLTSAKAPASSTDPAQVMPSITTQPASQTVAAGQTATFSVTASGTAPLSYQWWKNGKAISGATSASYTTPATTISDSGSPFTVTVSNPTGSVTSKTATLSVNAATLALSITTQPTNQTVTAGQTATFSVAASGTAPLSYQWRKNGTAISGAASTTYTTPATATSDNESPFSVVVSNSTGNVTSNIATLTVSAGPVAPSITAQPASQTEGVRFADQFCATSGILDQSCIQNALNDLPPGGMLVIPLTASGNTYIINNQLLYAPTPISGFVYGPDIECQNGVVLDDRVSNNSMLLIKSLAPNKFLVGVHVRNCEILTTTNPPASNGIEMQQVWNSSIDNVSVHGLSGDGIRLSDAGGDAGSTQLISLNDNHVYANGGWGINLNTSTKGSPAIGGIDFNRNLITGNTAGGVRAAAIRGATFRDNGIAFNVGPGVHFQENGGCPNLGELFQGGSFDNNGGGHIEFDCGTGLVVEGVEFDFSVCCGFSTPFGIQVGNPSTTIAGGMGADIRANYFRVDSTNSGFIGINLTSNAGQSSAENNVFTPLASGQKAYVNSNPYSPTNENGNLVYLRTNNQ